MREIKNKPIFEYQRTSRFFAQISSGMEKLGAAELTELRASQVEPAFRGIYFEANKAALYRINYQSRLLSRILAPLRSFECPDPDILYEQASKIAWHRLFNVDNSFAIFASVSNSQITHSQYAALRLKDAIVDYFRNRTQQRPNVDRKNPDVWISLHIDKDQAQVSWDTSGGSLHRRGYRRKAVEAPMQETLAAAIIRLSGWDGSQPIYDPMCGSGTLLAEALMAQSNIPAGILRHNFGFEYLSDFDGTIWDKIQDQGKSQIQPVAKGLISGSDISGKAVETSLENLNYLPGGDAVTVTKQDFNSISNLNNRVIVSNPPYGIRMGDAREARKTYNELGTFLKQRCQQATAYIYFGDKSLIPAIGLRPAWKKPLRNGPLDGRLAKFEIF
ncbi:class I SAM-dependent RNA methyltransferase [bacterium]|nr:class I SAM-dependent RNA methyltransferase [bacterium]